MRSVSLAQAPVPSSPVKTAERNVLLIEEYDALSVAIQSALTKFAPHHRFHAVRSLAEARRAALEQKPELIILDFDLPHPGAIAFFGEMRGVLPGRGSCSSRPGLRLNSRRNGELMARYNFSKNRSSWWNSARPCKRFWPVDGNRSLSWDIARPRARRCCSPGPFLAAQCCDRGAGGPKAAPVNCTCEIVRSRTPAPPTLKESVRS